MLLLLLDKVWQIHIQNIHTNVLLAISEKKNPKTVSSTGKQGNKLYYIYMASKDNDSD